MCLQTSHLAQTIRDLIGQLGEGICWEDRGTYMKVQEELLEWQEREGAGHTKVAGEI